MAPERTILITAAGGNIGTELIPQLLQHKVKLVLPTSNASRLQSKLPSEATASNVAIEQGDIKDPQWIQRILTAHSVDTVFLCLTGTDELWTTLNFFDSMQRAGTVKHLVYLSACGDFVSAEGVKNVMSVCSASHVLVKVAIEQKIAYGNFPWTTTRLGPTLFFSNDERSKASMLRNGFFDEPLGEKGVSRVSTSDIALVAANTLLNPAKWAGQKIMIGSRKRYTGSEIAALWSSALGREVRMCGSDEAGLDAFEQHFANMIGGHMGAGEIPSEAKAWGRDLRLMYETFGKVGFGMSEEEYQVLVECLGREAKDYEGWVSETGKTWV